MLAPAEGFTWTGGFAHDRTHRPASRAGTSVVGGTTPGAWRVAAESQWTSDADYLRDSRDTFIGRSTPWTEAREVLGLGRVTLASDLYRGASELGQAPLAVSAELGEQRFGSFVPHAPVGRSIPRAPRAPSRRAPETRSKAPIAAGVGRSHSRTGSATSGSTTRAAGRRCCSVRSTTPPSSPMADSCSGRLCACSHPTGDALVSHSRATPWCASPSGDRHRHRLVGVRSSGSTARTMTCST